MYSRINCTACILHHNNGHKYYKTLADVQAHALLILIRRPLGITKACEMLVTPPGSSLSYRKTKMRGGTLSRKCLIVSSKSSSKPMQMLPTLLLTLQKQTKTAITICALLPDTSRPSNCHQFHGKVAPKHLPLISHTYHNLSQTGECFCNGIRRAFAFTYAEIAAAKAWTKIF